MEAKNLRRRRPNLFRRLMLSYRKIPDRKVYIEFITAILSIPVLLTVIILNFNTLFGQKAKTPVTPTEKIYITSPAEKNTTNISTQPCTPGIGFIDIASPVEGETVTDNPVSVSINYDKNGYCEVVWSYRINNGKWSDYDDKSIALYNPPQGAIKFDLRVKSIVNSDTDSLTRNFIYRGTSIINSPVSSSSAN